MENEKLWYALQRNGEDDWGTGCWNREEAVKNMLDSNGYYKLIAVIENDACIEEIYVEDYEGIERELDEIPFDVRFPTGRGEELCHSTGIEVFLNGEWWNEYVDSEGEFHYGR